MRRTTLWAVSTVSALVLLLSYRTSTMGAGGTADAAASATPSTSSSTSSGTSSGSASGTSSSTSSGSDGSSSSSDGTYTGDSVETRWGPVQVQVTVADDRITDVSAVVYPQENRRDLEINSYALPVLHDEVVSAQSADVDAVSGATVTSDGYLTSLQSALDAAHLGS